VSNHPVDADQPLAFLLSTPAVGQTSHFPSVRELKSPHCQDVGEELGGVIQPSSWWGRYMRSVEVGRNKNRRGAHLKTLWGIAPKTPSLGRGGQLMVL